MDIKEAASDGISPEAIKAASAVVKTLEAHELEIAIGYLLDNQKHVAPDLAADCAIAVAVYRPRDREGRGE